MEHVMLDLETWGTKPGSAIRSIGMVQFDPFTPEFGQKFYCNVDKESQTKLGATIDKNTEEWWLKQSKEAREALDHDQMSVEQTCLAVIQYFKSTNAKFVWAQGSNFDPVLLEAIFDMVGMRVPWKYYNTRDTRSIYHAANFDDRTIPRVGNHHNALHDAMHQVRCIYRCFEILSKGTGK